MKGEDVIHALYFRGSGSSSATKQKGAAADVTPETFKKRAYWLIKDPKYTESREEKAKQLGAEFILSSDQE